MKTNKTLRLLFIATLISAIYACQHIDTIESSSRIEQDLSAHSQWQSEQFHAQTVIQLIDLLAIPELNELINQGLKNNPGIQSTALAIQVAYLQKKVTRSDALPAVQLDLDADNAKGNDTTYSNRLSVSWELDLWERIADSVRRDEMSIAQIQSNYQATRDALAADIMRNWLNIIYQQQLIKTEKQRLGVLKKNQDIILKRYRVGLGELEDLDTANSTIASTKGTLVEYEEELANAHRSLKQILGELAIDYHLPTISHFPAVIVPLATEPKFDLARRPDLQAIYYDILAKQYAVSVAYKMLLPRFSLTASLEESNSDLSDVLFKSPAWNLLGNLTAPLYQGGMLRAEAEIAELDKEKAFLNYKEQLLEAVYEVETGLSREYALEQQQTHIREALRNAKRSAAHYQLKYRKGLVDVLDLLTVQKKTFDLQIQVTQIMYQQLTNRIDLGLALGLGVMK